MKNSDIGKGMAACCMIFVTFAAIIASLALPVGMLWLCWCAGNWLMHHMY